MIFSDRVRLSGTLLLRSDLHVGTGAVVQPDITRSQDAASIQIAGITMGVSIYLNMAEAPFIPATSLKGALKARARKIADFDVAKVFGSIKHTETESGQVGRLWIEGAALVKAAVVDTSETSRSKATHVTHHVAIEPQSGAAAPNKLFAREIVNAGSTFGFSATWFGSLEDDDLKVVLGLLLGGLSMGRGSTKGHGTVNLVPDSLRIEQGAARVGALSFTLLPAEEAKAYLKALATPAVPAHCIPLTLTCDGPVMSISAQSDARTDRGNTLSPITREQGFHLQPESLYGALRSRARWIAEVEQRRELGVLTDERVDQSDKPLMETSTDIKKARPLSAVERLFGVTGWRGRLSLRELNSAGTGERIEMTSTSIDRFTGGGRDGYLFNEVAFDKAELKVELQVEYAGEDDEDKNKDAISFLERLVDDLVVHGIDLGHGAAKGFGWFKVERGE